MFRLHNTLSGELEPFEPIDPSNVRVFVCGPTVYGPTHLGHAKTYTQFDFLVGLLRREHPSLTYVQNITDLDDKIIGRAAEEGTDSLTVARRWEESFHQSMAALGNKQVDHYHRAHDHVSEVIDQVQRLLEAGVAYIIPALGVYFEVAKFPSHGALARRNVEDEATVSRLGSEGELKRGAGDFAVWKFSAGVPSWEAPFGRGRPGWHIEDTAITEHYFGPQYDLHGGATDLIFPHHEAEIAQMESLSGQPLVKYWLHTGLLEVNGKKMGKSLGNALTLAQVLERWDTRAVRHALLRVHYRSTMNFSEANLNGAAQEVQRVENYYSSAPERGDGPTIEELWSFLEEDFATPRLWAAFFTALRAKTLTRSTIEQVNEWFGGIFDLTSAQEEAPPEVLELVAQRQLHRAAGEWAIADELRGAITKAGYSLKDTPEGTQLTPLA